MEIITAILAVFSAIGQWISTEIPNLLAIFYVAETGLTFIGVLAVCGLAFSIVFLLISVIQNFLHFRG